MKIFAFLALAVAIHAQAEPSMAGRAQAVCAKLAIAGQSAADSNNRGYDETLAREIWAESVRENASGNFAESLTRIGFLQIHAVYVRNITESGEGYWTGYNTCMQGVL